MDKSVLKLDMGCFIFILDVPVHTYSEEYIEEKQV